MTLLKKGRGKEVLRRFTLKLPIPTLDYLGVYAMAKGFSRSRIARTVLDDWAEAAKVEETEEMLVDEVVDRAEDQWDLACKLAKSRGEPEPLFKSFLLQLEEELAREDPRYARKQAVSPRIAEMIMDRIYEKNRELLK
jgi:hypothetical protein